MRPGLPDRVHRHGRPRHEGPLPRPLGPRRDVRRAARGIGPPVVRPARARSRLHPLRGPRRPGSRRDPRGPRPISGPDAPDPRGDPGRLRLPPGRGPEADQSGHRGVVRDDLRDRLVLPAPPLRAAGGRGPGCRGQPPPPGRGSLPGQAGGLARWSRWWRRMTDVTILETPKGWPAILLPRPDAAARKPTKARGRADEPAPTAEAAGEVTAADPADLDAAVRAGAFEGLRKAARDLGATATIAAVGAAGLRGRGGAGYPAADKWRVASGTPAAGRGVVANGYGADPSSQTDRALLERNPYAVIEGLAIAAYAIGAEEAIIAVRAEATVTIRILEAALAAAAEAGFVGTNVLGAGRHLDVTVRPVPPAYLLGEETILLKALEGKRGQPEQRPPHPATRGLRDRPTVVHNAQTLAAIPWILVNRAEAFTKVGAAAPRGTPLRDGAALAGPLGAGRTLKALLVGGPSGGILPPDRLDTPYDFEPLRAAGAHIGSGSVIVAAAPARIV